MAEGLRTPPNPLDPSWNGIARADQDAGSVPGDLNDAAFGLTRAEVGAKRARYKPGERFTDRWIVP